MRCDTAVLVLSFDGNRDMWQPFFRFFTRYWQDCPYPIYLVVNEFDFEFPNIKVVKTGPASNWSAELKTALSQINEKNLIVFLEDYFIYDRVDNELIDRAIGLMDSYNADYIRLGTFPKRYKSLWPAVPLPAHPGFHKVQSVAKYLINLQVSIWKKDVLQGILVDGESPWDFEINASRRFEMAGYTSLGLDPKPGITHVHGPIVYLCGALTRGVLMRAAIRLARQENIPLETGSRRRETFVEELFRKFYIALPLPARKVYLALKSRLTAPYRLLLHSLK